MPTSTMCDEPTVEDLVRWDYAEETDLDCEATTLQLDPTFVVILVQERQILEKEAATHGVAEHIERFTESSMAKRAAKKREREPVDEEDKEDAELQVVGPSTKKPRYEPKLPSLQDTLRASGKFKWGRRG
uniref:Uncharacterized protein n=1 Tax=Mycena chlorophos TaxID=658473 RepID=A0ABQ0L601_MYCCL|nr:predicted protein [Mycena chlorophos]